MASPLPPLCVGWLPGGGEILCGFEEILRGFEEILRFAQNDSCTVVILRRQPKDLFPFFPEGIALGTVAPPARAGEALVQPAAAFADPADPAGGDACHQGIIGNVVRDDGPGGYQCAAADGVAADDRAVRAQARALAYARTRKDAMRRKVRTGRIHVGKDAGRPAEDVVFQVHAFVDRDVVLDTDAVADRYPRTDVDVLSEGAVAADDGAGLDMAEVPYLRPGSDGCAGIHVAALMHESVLHCVSLQYFYIVTGREGLGDVLGVEDSLGVLLHEGVIDAGVCRRDDDDIRRLHERCGQFLFTRIPDAAVAVFRDERVIIADVGPFFAELLDHADGGGLAIVVDVLLVGYAEDQDTGALQGLGEAMVEHVADALDAVLGHAVVDHHRGLDHRGVEAVFAGFPAQVIGIERDAVAAQARAGIEGREAERLGLGRFDDLPEVDPHLVAEDCELVDQADVDVAVGVLQDLGHLRHGGGGGPEYFPLQDGFVHGRDHFGGVCTEAADHLGGVLGLVDQVAGIDPLGAEAEVKVLAALQAGGLEDGLDQLFGGSGVGGGLEDDHHPAVQVPGDRAGRGLDIADVRLLVGVEGRGDADGDEIHLLDKAEIGRGGEAALLHQAGEVGVHDILDIVFAGIDQIDFLFLDIEPDGPESGLGFFYGQGESNIAEAYNPGYDGFILNFL